VIYAAGRPTAAGATIDEQVSQLLVVDLDDLHRDFEQNALNREVTYTAFQIPCSAFCKMRHRVRLAAACGSVR
jgi:hypothetical protein